MLVLKSPQVVQETALRWKRENRVALVPTMGALHEAHRRLIRSARQHGSKVIASIFVNPLQFGPQEDFHKYPRPLEEDQRILEEEQVDLLFLPSVEDLYPPHFASRVSVAGLTEHLCGPSRPGHFEGVATVCLKLFQISQADFAIFGEKDFQQLRVLQQMAADFNLPLTLVPHPTVREEDGLALSSRNRYLSDDERKRAAKLPETLRAAQRASMSGGAAFDGTVGAISDAVRRELASAGFAIDYVTVAPSDTLTPAMPSTRLASLAAPRLFIAAKLGQTRLIDNVPLGTLTL